MSDTTSNREIFAGIFIFIFIAGIFFTYLIYNIN